MRTIYIDCGMGAAGDMLVAALTELTEGPDKTIEELNGLHLPHTHFVREASVKCGITGTHIRVIVDGAEEDEDLHGHSHAHAGTGHAHEHAEQHGLHSIRHIVRDHLAVPEPVREDILAVYGLLAEAESRVHGRPVEEIHFHELGTADALADITAACYLIHKLRADTICASPVHVGRGTVRCAHGILPIPAPATALLLEGIPIYSRQEIEGELCTPTGAALLKYYVREFGPMPVLTIEKIGYGMGRKDFPIANCVRALLGESGDSLRGKVQELDFNVDDMTGEEVGYLTEKLLVSGALEVFVTPVFMKKNRPGNLITVLYPEEKELEIVRLIFRDSTTIGIRKTAKERFVLERKATSLETGLGTVRKKESSGYGVKRTKFEYEDLAKIAEEQGLSIREVRERIERGNRNE